MAVQTAWKSSSGTGITPENRVSASAGVNIRWSTSRKQSLVQWGKTELSVINVLSSSIGQSAHKTLVDKFPATQMTR